MDFIKLYLHWWQVVVSSAVYQVSIQERDNTYGIQFHKKASGILIPVCALDGRVEGFQIRLDHPIEDKKYIWFSSSNQFRGASIGGPVHFIGNPAAKTVYVTEGALKANVAH